MAGIDDLVKTLRKIAAKELDFEKEIKAIADKLVKDFSKKIIDNAPTERRSISVIDTSGNRRRETATVIVSGTKLDDFILRLPKLLEKSLKDIGFTGKAQNFVQNFDTVKDANLSFHESQNKRKADRAVVTSITNQMKKLVADRLTNANGTLSQTMLVSIRQTLQNNAVSSVPLTTTIDQIGDYIAGTPDTAGQFSRIATLTSRDGYFQYQGKIDQELSTQFGYNAYRYIGSLVEESRPQCVRWADKGYILFSELEKEIEWAENNGSGMIEGTTPDNFAEFRGGYNCRHFAVPVFIEPTEETNEE